MGVDSQLCHPFCDAGQGVYSLCAFVSLSAKQV